MAKLYPGPRQISFVGSPTYGGAGEMAKGVDFSVVERLAKALGMENPLHLFEYVPETEKGRRR
jgi:hypothetical protein